MTAPLLQIEDLCVAFRTRTAESLAVEGFSLTVQAGETVGLVGESGCGKSTVALAIMRDLGARGRIASGAIRFRGRDMGEMSARELRALRGDRMAMVFQEPMSALNPSLRIERQLMEIPMIHEGASAAQARRRALEMIEAVRLPDPLRIAQSWPHELSGGQQQRVVIAMALMARPDLLILDEPTTALDVTVQAGIMALLRDLGREMGAAMLLISHDLGLVMENCDRLCVMYAGEAAETGPVPEVAGRMRHPYTQGLFRSIPRPGADRRTRPLVPIPGAPPSPGRRPPGCAFAPRCAHAVPGLCDAARPPMQDLGEGHATRCLRQAEIDWNAAPEASEIRHLAPPGDPILTVDRLRKYYEIGGGLFGGGARVARANETLSFEAREAETLAIVGESGCGKSTLAKVLMGLETATAGQAWLAGEEIAHLPAERRRPDQISAMQMVFQNPAETLNPSRSVGAQIIRTLEKFRIGDSHAMRRERMFRLLDAVKLPRAFADRLPRQLSGGQKQRIGIARAFAGQARVVVADEPVSALDVSVQATVTELLGEMQRDRRATLIFISHDLGVVRYLADRVLVMYLGHVVEMGAAEQVFAPPFHPYTEALLEAAPVANLSARRRAAPLDGDPPSVLSPPSGCPFQTRCPRKAEVADGRCETDLPRLRPGAEGHLLRCHLSPEALAGETNVSTPSEITGTPDTWFAEGRPTD